MGFFRSLFGKGSADSGAVTVTASAPAGNAIGHDPRLIQSLLDDHAKLGALFARLGSQAEIGRYDEVRSLLAQFKSSLQAHILTENVRFYTYLERSLQGDAHSAETMREFRREMNTIAREVVDFTKKYQDARFTSTAESRQFNTDYKAIGVLLERRLDNEEHSLYPMYQPS